MDKLKFTLQQIFDSIELGCRNQLLMDTAKKQNAIVLEDIYESYYSRGTP